MSGDVYTAILTALHKRLFMSPLVSPPQPEPPAPPVPGIPVAWPGESFNPGMKPYLRPTFLPGDARALALPDASSNSHVGLYQIDVFVPRTNQYQSDVLLVQTADALAGWFHRGLVLREGGYKVTLQTPSTLASVMRPDAWSMLPVRATWRTFAT